MSINLDSKRLWVLCVFERTVLSCGCPNSLFHLCLLGRSWDYHASFEMDLIFPKLAFTVMEGNAGRMEQSLGKSHHLGFISMVHTQSKIAFRLYGKIHR